jgi:hypothetical protein
LTALAGPAPASTAALPPIIETAREGLPRVAAGKAVAERLGPVIVNGVGPFAAARGGDWRLSNERLSLTFAATDDWPATLSMPLAGYSPILYPEHRLPGALIDVAFDGATYDNLGYLTQGAVVGAGPNAASRHLQYDTAEALIQDDRVGLRFAGHPFDNSLARLETTYWLGENDERVSVESRLIGLRPGEPVPALGDLAQWQTLSVMNGNRGVLLQGRDGSIDGEFYAVYNGVFSVALTPTTATLSGRYLGRANVLCTDLTPTTRTADDASEVAFSTRRLWFANGHFADLQSRIFAERKADLGELSGAVQRPGGLPHAPRSKVSFFRVEPEEVTHWEPPSRKGQGPVEIIGKLKNVPPQFMGIAQTDEQGRYSVTLPAGYYAVMPEESLSPKTGLAEVIGVKAGRTTDHDFPMPKATGVLLRVRDAVTSEPLAAKVAFVPVPPTRQVNYEPNVLSRAVGSTYYLKPEGERIDIPAGKYVVKVTHGPRYPLLDQLIEVSPDRITSYTLGLRQTVPTPGWVSVDMGARTTATPGCVIAPEDYLLLAAAEGLDWVISGDYERLTDFAPVIDKLGLNGKLRSSIGFRTLLPAHPEWGHLFVFPVAKDAPDPALVRKEWANVKTSTEWVATLRRLYPGSFIQVDTPLTKEGAGYFNRRKATHYEVAWDPAPDADPSVDALNILPALTTDKFELSVSLYCINMVRGRRFIASTAPASRSLIGGEPGFPRMLVRVAGKPVDLAAVDETTLFDQMRRLRTQLTNGPFIEFQSGDALPGDTIPLDPARQISVRVTSPNWAPASRFVINKEDKGQVYEVVNLEDNEVQRYPVTESGLRYKTMSLADLQLLDIKDTLLDVTAVGIVPIKSGPATYTPRVNNFPMAFISPIVVDANNNGEFDPYTIYGTLGR